MSNELIYLASPYSAPTANQRTRRYKAVCKKAAKLMEEGYNIFCPIAHSHPIETIGMSELHDGDFWLKQDFAILEHCTKMFVFCIPGWQKSKGIAREIDFAAARGIPVEYIQ
jgi:nucleoside 2-deoxyribosyltransferase